MLPERGSAAATGQAEKPGPRGARQGWTSDEAARRALVGSIILAKFLERPLASFERLVLRTDAEMSAMTMVEVTGAPVVARGVLPGAAWEAPSRLPTRALAMVEDRDGDRTLRYRSEALVREYRVDESALDRFLAAHSDGGRAQALRLLARMRLVNSRNRLTHAVLSAAVGEQAAFVR